MIKGYQNDKLDTSNPPFKGKNGIDELYYLNENFLIKHITNLIDDYNKSNETKIEYGNLFKNCVVRKQSTSRKVDYIKIINNFLNYEILITEIEILFIEGEEVIDLTK